MGSVCVCVKVEWVDEFLCEHSKCTQKKETQIEWISAEVSGKLQ